MGMYLLKYVRIMARDSGGDCGILGVGAHLRPILHAQIGTNFMHAALVYFNPLLPGFTGVLPALHRGQASG